ncbi:putative candidate secreted effector protein [Blumeria hordei DH14]|uniref:Putative candidate secreted effector protein n=1 Tax=Blumeria graminis f. sp. hordei (strain DH14) TaxID=546991 RepID=N1JGM2_BLUG1|nr:putative candidate secreted effector protein [Blumeria hordei DH14]
MMHLFLTGVALKVIFLTINLFSLSEGQGFECSTGEIVDQDLESIRQLACNSLHTGNAESSVDSNSQGKEEVGFEWKLPNPLTLEQFNGGMITQLQLTENCEISSITISSKENESNVCPRNIAIHKRQDREMNCHGVKFSRERLIYTASTYCTNGVVDLDKALSFPQDYWPEIFSTEEHHIGHVGDFGKIYRAHYSIPSSVVYDGYCNVVGAIVYIDFSYKACSFVGHIGE